jgi:hypothetical protein
MNTPISIIPAKPRVRRKRRAVASAPTPPPVTPDQILSVVLDGSHGCIATLSTTIGAIVDPSEAMWLTVDTGFWIAAIGADIVDDTHVRFAFGDDVSACLMWHIEDPAAWQWLDGGGMNPPLDGEISP